MITNTITQLKKNWILISVCIFAIAISLINVENNLIQGLLETIILALLTYLGIRIANYLSLQKDVDEIINEKILENSLNVLKVEDVGLIQNFYKKEAIDQVFRNCLKWYNTALADTCSNFIHNCFDVIQKDFNYNVTIFQKQITQELSYHRLFLKDQSTQPIEMTCCFILSKNELDKQLNNNSFFFREELKDTTLRDTILNILKNTNLDDTQKKNEILNNIKASFKFELFINNKSISVQNITLKYPVDYKYFTLSAIVPKEDIKSAEHMEKYTGYKGKIKCTYNYPESDTFYCVFANPTLVTSDTNTELFRITIDGSTGINPSQVKTMTFLPIAKDKYQLESGINYFCFKAKESILPRSGICFSW